MNKRSIATVSLSGPLDEKLRAIAAAGFDGADEPFTPLFAFALQHGMHEVGLRAEQLVERGLRGAGFVDDGVDAGGVDAVLAEQPRRRTQQTSARGFIVGGNECRCAFLPRKRFAHARQ